MIYNRSYANDVVFSACSNKYLQKIIDSLVQMCKEYGMKIMSRRRKLWNPARMVMFTVKWSSMEFY